MKAAMEAVRRKGMSINKSAALLRREEKDSEKKLQF